MRERERADQSCASGASLCWLDNTQMSSQLCIFRVQGQSQTDVLYVFYISFYTCHQKTVQKKKDRLTKIGKRDTGSNIKANFGKNSKQVYTYRITLSEVVIVGPRVCQYWEILVAPFLRFLAPPALFSSVAACQALWKVQVPCNQRMGKVPQVGRCVGRPSQTKDELIRGL